MSFPKRHFFSFISTIFISLLFLPPKTGAASNWISSTPLPIEVGFNNGVTFDETNKIIYTVGGATGTGTPLPEQPISTIYRGKLNENLSINWEKLPQTLPYALRYNAVIIYQGYLYSCGGKKTYDPDHDDDRNAKECYRAQILANGDLGNIIQTAPLPADSSGGQFFIYQNRLYYIDGFGTKTVLRLKTDLSAWEKIGDLDRNLLYSNLDRGGYSNFASWIAYDRLYLAGGFINEGSDTDCQLDKILMAPFNTDGTLGTWTQIGKTPDGFFIGAYFDGYRDLDHGIKAHFKAHFHENKVFIFPAASYCSSPSAAWTFHTTCSGSTLRTFVAQLKSDGTLGPWHIFGPDETSYPLVTVGGQIKDNWVGGFNGQNWIHNSLASNFYGSFLYQGKAFIVGGENYAGHTSQVAYLDLSFTKNYSSFLSLLPFYLQTSSSKELNHDSLLNSLDLILALKDAAGPDLSQTGYGENMLAFAGFEFDPINEGLINSRWSATNLAKSFVTEAHAGKKSILLAKNSAGTSSVYQDATSSHFDIGKKIKFSAWVKNKGSQTVNLTLACWEMGGSADPQNVAQSLPLPADNQWHLIESQGTILSGKRTQLRLELYVGTNNASVLLDDTQVRLEL